MTSSQDFFGLEMRFSSSVNNTFVCKFSSSNFVSVIVIGFICDVQRR